MKFLVLLLTILFSFNCYAAGLPCDADSLIKLGINNVQAQALGCDTGTGNQTVTGTLTTSGAVTVASGGITETGAIVKNSADAGTFTIGETCVTEAVDSGAGTQTITAAIPAAAVVLGVSCRVDTVIAGAGAASFALGDGTDADLYGTGLAFAEGTTVDATDYTASPLTQAWSASAAVLTMTANAGQFDSGSITCCTTHILTAGPAS